MPPGVTPCKRGVGVNAVQLKKAIQFIEKAGVLLVFPLQNKAEPASLWKLFFPKEEMRWEWDEDGDNRVADLWHLRTELSESKKVVYAKWWRGRATLFSRKVFPAFLNRLRDAKLSHGSQAVMDLLLEESPLSTKALKKRAKLQGQWNERNYNKVLKELWTRLLIVGFGEVDDGAFPSLNIGATQLMFEDLYLESHKLSKMDVLARLALVGEKSLFIKELHKYEKLLQSTPPTQPSSKKIIRGSDLSLFTKN